MTALTDRLGRPFVVLPPKPREELAGMKTVAELLRLLVVPKPARGLPRLLFTQDEATRRVLEFAAENDSIGSPGGSRVSRSTIDRLVNAGFLVWRGSPSERRAEQLAMELPSTATAAPEQEELF